MDARPDPAMACHVGVYRLDDGSWVDLAPVVGTGLRWRRLDGSSSRLVLNADGRWVSTLGWTDRVDGPQPQPGTCEEGRIVFEGHQGRREVLDAQDTTFDGQGGTRLKGRLILPPGDGPVPIMVEVHGSEGANALDFNAFQRFAPASGVGVFVYAKRGSGGSEGHTPRTSIFWPKTPLRQSSRRAGWAGRGQVGLVCMGLVRAAGSRRSPPA